MPMLCIGITEASCEILHVPPTLIVLARLLSGAKCYGWSSSRDKAQLFQCLLITNIGIWKAKFEFVAGEPIDYSNMAESFVNSS